MAKIMVIDDSSIMRRSMISILQQAGHTVVAEADSGVTACQLYLEYEPDLVTMDLAMPDMDGLEAMRRITAADSTARIVVISALGSKAKIMEAITAGASHFIIKPITYDKVVKIIKNVLETNISPQDRILLAERLLLGDAAGAPVIQVEPAVREESSYKLESRHGKFIHITIQQGITVAQVEQLATDIEDCLFAGHRRFLLDFGGIVELPSAALVEIAAVVASIHAEDGQVRAMAESDAFIWSVKNGPQTAGSGLAQVLRKVDVRNLKE